ncbi:hypothetical protein [Bradyrhizobium sp. SZCCHNR2035]|uniref:hypothetical protein n=1 Tax=Bradyrhizobium sp. SZCCHNR2035 TaxID=3057386 RepID=UPI002916C5BD|nr:hypothetical protein [Bradyrhizobium sp. SZCCHNR2035]
MRATQATSWGLANYSACRRFAAPLEHCLQRGRSNTQSSWLERASAAHHFEAATELHRPKFALLNLSHDTPPDQVGAQYSQSPMNTQIGAVIKIIRLSFYLEVNGNTAPGRRPSNTDGCAFPDDC